MNATITRPTLLIDEAKCRRNIREMAEKARRHGLVLRPHVKTHQSLEIGRWFREAGVDKITVSSVSMAEYFAPEWDDITIAFPVNIREMEAINALAGRITLNLLVENEESVTFLQDHLTSAVNVYLKIDVGYHRTGIDPEAAGTIDHLAGAISRSAHMHFAGLLGHAGHTYQCRSAACIKEKHAASLQIMAALKARLQSRYPGLLISLGDTPSCSVADEFSGADEIRPGNFVFYDLTQQKIGSCDYSQIAVAMACPIVSRHPSRSEVVVYGGGVHFSKDRLEGEPEGTIFGRVVAATENGWGDPLPGTYVKSLSQEHGIVAVPPEAIDHYRIGDYLLVLPVHSCMAADLLRSYTTLEGKVINR